MQKLTHFMDLLNTALQAEAEECLGESYLVTVDFENVVPGFEGEVSVELSRLKVSARSCFLQARLIADGSTIFKGRAIFKAKSAS